MPNKKSMSKSMHIAETAVWMVFVLASGLGAMSILNMVQLTDGAKAFIGYALAAFSALVFGYLVYKAVENK